jgi:molecular chaperone GrpE (heat shock protein)
MDKKYTGMTVNERLYVSGLLDEFEKAIKEKNVDKVISILKEVELSDKSINPILEKYRLKKISDE